MSLANAILQGDETVVVNLLEAGALVNALDEYGYTPLIEAAIANNTAMAQILLKYHANINDPDLTGNTALHWSVENSNVDLTRILLNAGANPNAYSRAAQPVLLKPLLRRQEDIKSLLYQHGADLHFTKDYINAKLLGHRFELTGRVDILDPKGQFIEVALEGFMLEFTVELILDSLEAFRHNFAARELRPHFHEMQMVIDSLIVAAELLRYQQYQVDRSHYHDRIHALLRRDPLLVPVGYEGHAVTFIRFGRLLAKCDRGANSKNQSSVIIYRVNRMEALNTALFKYLLYSKQSAEFIESEIFQYLEATPITQLPVSSQISGNCSWANIEASIPTLLFLLFMQHATDQKTVTLIDNKARALTIFERWREWDKDRALNECIEIFQRANPARKASKVALLAAILFQTCYYHRNKDYKRADRILKVLSEPGYEYALESYLKIYGETPAGKNLQQLIDICGK